MLLAPPTYLMYPGFGVAGFVNMLLLPDIIVVPVLLLFLNTKLDWFCALADICWCCS